MTIRDLHIQIDDNIVSDAAAWLTNNGYNAEMNDLSGLGALCAVMSSLQNACAGKQNVHDKVYELQNFGNQAVLLFNPGAPMPFIAAQGYDHNTRRWECGTYGGDVLEMTIQAIQDSRCEHIMGNEVYDLLTADAEALEDSAIWWSRGDLAVALEDHGIDPDDELIDDLAKRLDNMRDWRDEVYNLGKRMITEAIIDLQADAEANGKTL